MNPAEQDVFDAMLAEGYEQTLESADLWLLRNVGFTRTGLNEALVRHVSAKMASLVAEIVAHYRNMPSDELRPAQVAEYIDRKWGYR